LVVVWGDAASVPLTIPLAAQTGVTASAAGYKHRIANLKPAATVQGRLTLIFEYIAQSQVQFFANLLNRFETRALPVRLIVFKFENCRLGKTRQTGEFSI
jgi:hypothetical protein